MSQENPRHLPPEALDDWMAKIASLLGIDEKVDVASLLDLTRDVAHDVARPAAPLTTFALGIALGRRPEAEFEPEFKRLCSELSRLAAEQAGR